MQLARFGSHAGMSAALFVVASAALLAPAARAGNGSDARPYTFEEAPANSMGVKGMGDLLGKPVLIDFWGTR